MRPLQTDLSIYSKFNFETSPVGVKFLISKPHGIEQLDKSTGLCEMIKEAKQGAPFYITKENEDCVGKLPLGWEEMPPFAESGQLGVKSGIFQEARANGRIYLNIPKFSKGVVNYVAFSTLDNLTFEPDLLIILAPPSDAEIVLRAMTYSTGELYEPKTANVLACAWLYAYPFQSGKVNFTITGLGFGMKGRRVFPEGLVLISILYNWIPTITENLKEMEWVLPAYTLGREKFIAEVERLHNEIAQEFQNP